MNNELVERYVYAVTKGLNSKLREDVSAELRGLVDDMLAERCGENPPTEKDIRVVLTELGNPHELAAKYDDDAQKYLIGQPYYTPYKMVLKIVLACVAIGMTISSAVLQVMEPMQWHEAILNWVSMLWQGLMGSFAFVTLLFAFFCRKGVKLEESFDFDDLPPVPQKKQEISKWEAIVGIGFDVVFLALFLAAPQLLGMIMMETGEVIPIFNVEAIRASWLVIVLFGALGIVREAVKLVEGRYNQKILAVTVVTDLLSAGLAAWWLTGADMFNPAFAENILAHVGNDGAVVVGIFERFPQFFLAVMIFALALDILNTLVKTLRK